MANIFRKEVVFRNDRHRDTGVSIAELFHENTKFHPATVLASPPGDSYEVRELDAMSRGYKRYRLHPQVPLPTQVCLSAPPFNEVVASRRSIRDFAPDELTMDQVSAILRWSYGVTGEEGMPGGGRIRLRASPSAGALYPAEVYLGVRGVHGIERGIYHYEVPVSALALLHRGDFTDRLCEVCCGQEYARQAAVVVLITGFMERTKRKYGDRGYRYVLLDIGHLGENLYLGCTALGLAMVTTCGFYDDEAADLLGIEGNDEAVFYVAFIGKKPLEAT